MFNIQGEKCTYNVFDIPQAD